MKSYFGPNGEFEGDALRVLQEVDTFMRELYKREHGNGFNFRELTAIVNGSAFDSECNIGMDVNAPTQAD